MGKIFCHLLLKPKLKNLFLSPDLELTLSSNPSISSLFLKFEKIKQDPAEEIKKIIIFFKENYNIEIKNSDQKVENLIKTTDFNKLKQIEEDSFFPENKENSTIFFRKGSCEQWKDNLTKDQINLILNKFNSEMKELKYI